MLITLSVNLFLTVMLTSLRKILSTIHHTSIYSIRYLVFSLLNHSYSLVYTSYNYLDRIIKEYNLSITDLVTRIILTVNPLLTESGTPELDDTSDIPNFFSCCRRSQRFYDKGDYFTAVTLIMVKSKCVNIFQLGKH